MNKKDFKRLVNGFENGKHEMTDAQNLNARIHTAVKKAAEQSKKREEELFKALEKNENFSKRMPPLPQQNNS